MSNNDNIAKILGEELALIAKLSNARNDAIGAVTAAVLLKVQMSIPDFKPESIIGIHEMITRAIDESFAALDLEKAWRDSMNSTLAYHGINVGNTDGAELSALDPVSRTAVGCAAYRSLSANVTSDLLADLTKEAKRRANS